jgi:hypothetical protein
MTDLDPDLFLKGTLFTMTQHTERKVETFTFIVQHLFFSLKT